MEKLTRAIITAAGTGTRLQPLTLKIPKPLVPVNGVRMIDTEIRALREQGICEIYIVTGHLQEKFHEAYDGEPDIRLIHNPHYLDGNNVTSLYAAREYLPGSFVLEADLTVLDKSILDPSVEKSGYCATWMEPVPSQEWALDIEDGHIISCNITGNKNAYRLWGISMWTRKDGEMLAGFLKEQIEVKKNWNVYWDELPLFLYADRFDLGVRPVPGDALREIDSLEELASYDPSYRSYLRPA